jgi:hypothetical protein
MRKRKRIATTMDELTENSVAPASHATASLDALSGEDGQFRRVLRPRPNPPSERARLSRQLDKEECAVESCKLQEAVKVKPHVPNAGVAATSLPVEIWRLVGQNVHSLSVIPFMRRHELITSFDNYRYLFQKP